MSLDGDNEQLETDPAKGSPEGEEGAETPEGAQGIPAWVLEAPTGDHERPCYANGMQVAHDPHGFVLTFCFADMTSTVEPPTSPTVARILARVAVSPTLMLSIIATLASSYDRYAKRYPELTPGGVGPPWQEPDEVAADDAAVDDPQAEGSEE